MSLLFHVDGRAVMPRTETLLISPFKEIWERDTDPNKETAKQEFSYIEFTTSMLKSNPYAGYPEEEKPKRVREDCIHIEDWVPDELIERGRQRIIEFQTNASVTYRYYMSAKIGAEKTMLFFETLDLGKLNFKTGNPLYKPKDVTGALNETNKVMQNLNDMKKKVEEELFDATKNKGDKEISFFAQPESLL